MRKGVVPDDKIAGPGSQRDCAQCIEILFTRMGAGREGCQPFICPLMKTGHQGKGALIRIGIGQVKNTLQAEGDRLFEAYIPVQTRTGK